MMVVEELQKEIFNKLNDFFSVYDEVPEKAIFPYITLQVSDLKPFESKNSFGEEIDFYIHIWSVYNGKKEVYNIMEKITEILSYPIILEKNVIHHKKIVRRRVIDDIDGIKKHGIIQLRFYTGGNN